jgi:hypothetical protein
MKKNIILSLAVSLSIIAASAIFTLTQSISPQDKLLMENVAAFAGQEEGFWLWCSTEFQSVDVGGSWGVNCAFCDWDIYGKHSGSGACWID